MNIDDIWKRIETWLAVEAPEVTPSLLPGASENDILSLESSIGKKLPVDFRESLRRHEGQATDAESGLFPYVTFFSAPAWRLLSLAEIAQRRTEMYEDRCEFSDQKATLSSGEQTEWRPAELIPIGEDGGGDFACLDMSPNGAGRVVQFRHASAARELFAPSFGPWLAKLADDMEGGKYHYDPDNFGLTVMESND